MFNSGCSTDGTALIANPISKLVSKFLRQEDIQLQPQIIENLMQKPILNRYTKIFEKVSEKLEKDAFDILKREILTDKKLNEAWSECHKKKNIDQDLNKIKPNIQKSSSVFPTKIITARARARTSEDLDSMYKAIQRKDIKRIGVLLERGHVPFNEDTHGLVVRFAIEYCNLDILKELIRAGAVLTEYCTESAVSQNKLDILKYLINIGTPITTRTIIVSNNKNNKDMLKYLVSIGVPIPTVDDILMYHEGELGQYYSGPCLESDPNFEIEINKFERSCAEKILREILEISKSNL
jgi:hypothetical protein